MDNLISVFEHPQSDFGSNMLDGISKCKQDYQNLEFPFFDRMLEEGLLSINISTSFLIFRILKN